MGFRDNGYYVDNFTGNTSCAYCNVFGCPGRSAKANDWDTDAWDRNVLLYESGPPSHYYCGCSECISWERRITYINKCMVSKGLPRIGHTYWAVDPRSTREGEPVGRYDDGQKGPPQREYALHYTYWLNMPDMVHEVRESDFAPNGDAMYDKLSKRWPNINIISIDRVCE